MSLICPTCNKEFSHQGGFNLHKYHCSFKSMKQGQIVSRETEHKQLEKKECEHEWRFLDSNSSVEIRAINSGYSEVCQSCQSLRV